MAYAIDLSKRQSSRTLQQAIRHQAAVRLFPRTWEDERCLVCHLAGEEDHQPAGDDHLLVHTPTASLLPDAVNTGPIVEPASDGQDLFLPDGDVVSESEGHLDMMNLATPAVTADEFHYLRGVYCDVQLLLGDNRYLFSTDVMHVEPLADERGSWQIALDRPEEIQVLQRRRYWRFRPARSSRIEMRWKDDLGHKGVGIGWLCNISPDGMACRTDAQFSDHIYIGMTLDVTFKLDPSSNEVFTLDGVVCNKMPAGTKGKFILGLQFVRHAEDAACGETRERLRRHLLERSRIDRHASKGADL